MKKFLISFFYLVTLALPVFSTMPLPPKAIIVQEWNSSGNETFNSDAQRALLSLIIRHMALGDVVDYYQRIDAQDPVNVRKISCIELKNYEIFQRTAHEYKTALAPWSFDNKGNIEVISGSDCRR